MQIDPLHHRCSISYPNRSVNSLANKQIHARPKPLQDTAGEGGFQFGQKWLNNYTLLRPILVFSFVLRDSIQILGGLAWWFAHSGFETCEEIRGLESPELRGFCTSFPKLALELGFETPPTTASHRIQGYRLILPSREPWRTFSEAAMVRDRIMESEKASGE